MIEHLVLSSAGPYGFIHLGVISQSIDDKLIDMDCIQSICGTSAGAIVGLLLCLRIPMDAILDYFIERPFEKWVRPDLPNCIENKGVVPHECIQELVLPFFKAYDIPMDLTMEQLYTFNPIELHIFTTSVRTLELVDITYKSHPTISVLKAIAMSSSVPFIFTPVEHENEYYIDGALCETCPLITSGDNVFICMINSRPLEYDLSSPFQYLQHIFEGIILKHTQSPVPDGKHVVCYNPDKEIGYSIWIDAIYSKEYRKRYIDIGKKLVKIDTITST